MRKPNETQKAKKPQGTAFKIRLMTKKGMKNNHIEKSPLIIHWLLKRQSRRDLKVRNQGKVRVTPLDIKSKLQICTTKKPSRYARLNSFSVLANVLCVKYLVMRSPRSVVL